MLIIVVVVVVVVDVVNSSLEQCSPWSEDRLQYLWSGRLPQEENKYKHKIIHRIITETICIRQTKKKDEITVRIHNMNIIS